jgi:hypothetical protein
MRAKHSQGQMGNGWRGLGVVVGCWQSLVRASFQAQLALRRMEFDDARKAVTR